MDNCLTVTVLNGYIKGIFNAEEMLHNISVCGEVSGLRVSGGNAFFTLKDDNSAVQCNCFGVKNTYIPKDGETVILFGSVDYWHKAGKLSFNALSIRPLGEGALALKLEMLKKRLREEGYFDESHKKQLPAYPERICVITSASGAVIHDIIKTVRKFNTYTDIFVYDVPVQGNGCARAVCDAVEAADKMNFDVIIIARGGGSAEDLMPFNDESLVKKIYFAHTPIVSAVGHETDFTLCDMAADVRAATPTAAANIFAFDIKELIVYINDIVNRIGETLKNRMIDCYKNLSDAIKSMNYACMFKEESARNLLASEILKLKHLSVYNLTAAQSRLMLADNKLRALNPASILAKGYFILSKDGNNLKSIAQMSKGDKVRVQGADGNAYVSVNEVNI